MRCIQDGHFCWELAETTGVYFVFLSRSAHFLRLLGHCCLKNALVLKRLENLVMGLTLHFLQAHFIFEKAFNCLGKRSAV